MCVVRVIGGLYLWHVNHVRPDYKKICFWCSGRVTKKGVTGDFCFHFSFFHFFSKNCKFCLTKKKESKKKEE